MPRCLLVLLSLAILIAKAHADPVQVTWTNPSSYTDGSALTPAQITQTRIAWGTCVGTAFTKIGEQKLPGAPTSTNLDLGPGDYCIRAYTTASGVESDPTNFVIVSIADPAPLPLLTSGTYSYCLTGTATAPSMTAIGYLDAGLPCGPATRQVGSVKFCQITRAQTDIVGWCSSDKTLAKGIWSRAAP